MSPARTTHHTRPLPPPCQQPHAPLERVARERHLGRRVDGRRRHARRLELSAQAREGGRAAAVDALELRRRGRVEQVLREEERARGAAVVDEAAARVVQTEAGRREGERQFTLLRCDRRRPPPSLPDEPARQEVHAVLGVVFLGRRDEACAAKWEGGCRDVA